MVQRQVTTRISREDYSRMLKLCADLGFTPYEYFQDLIVNDCSAYEEHLKDLDNLDHNLDPIEAENIDITPEPEPPELDAKEIANRVKKILANPSI